MVGISSAISYLARVSAAIAAVQQDERILRARPPPASNDANITSRLARSLTITGLFSPVCFGHAFRRFRRRRPDHSPVPR